MTYKKGKGMTGKHHSKETIERIRLKKFANPTNYWSGKKRSEETKRKISIAKKRISMSEKNKLKIKLSAINNPNYGMRNKHMSKESKRKIGFAGLGRPAWNYLDGKCHKRKRLNTYKVHKIWCSQPENLPYVPEEFIIHHIDLNPENNNLNNLILLPRDYHSKYHNEISKVLTGRKSIWRG